MFKLGNHNIDEILFGAAQNFAGDLQYTLDQISNANVEISSDPTQYTDKKGNVVRTTYGAKSGTLNSTNAFLHPAIMNAGSGSEIKTATALNPIQMPKMINVAAGGTLDASKALEGSIQVIGVYGNGANSPVLTQGTVASFDDLTYALVTDEESGKISLSVPTGGVDAPIQYLIKYERMTESGIVLSNTVNAFPKAVRLTFMCSYVDPCSDEMKPVYLYIPSFMADPNMTISLDRETQEMAFNGALQIDYCSVEKNLYFLYYPDEELVVSGTAA